MIRNLIFDMGQVLIRFDPPYFIRKLGFAGEDSELLLREVFRSVEWIQLDRGSITDEEAIRRMRSRLPAHLHEAVEKLVTMWDRPILPVEGMEELLRELKEAGYRIYLLSNASLHQHEYWPRIPGSQYFDGKLISADIRLLKPDTEIYLHLLERFNLSAGECLFIDDQPTNVEAALRCGFSGVVFSGDTDLLRQELRRAGVTLAQP